MFHAHPADQRCACCGGPIIDSTCVSCDARLSSPPHVCLRTWQVITDEHGCEPVFEPLGPDHETAWRLDDRDGARIGWFAGRLDDLAAARADRRFMPPESGGPSG